MSLQIFNYSKNNSIIDFSNLSIQEDLFNQYNNKVILNINSTMTNLIPEIGDVLFFTLYNNNYYLIVSNRQEDYSSNGQSSNIILELTLLYNYLHLNNSKKYSKNLKELLEDLFIDLNKLLKDKNIVKLNYKIDDNYKNIESIFEPVYTINYSVLDFINSLKLRTNFFDNDGNGNNKNNIYTFFNLNGFIFKTFNELLDISNIKQEIPDYEGTINVKSNLTYNKYTIISENAYSNPDGIFKFEIDNGFCQSKLNLQKYIISSSSINSVVGCYDEYYNIMKDVFNSNVFSFSFNNYNTWNFNVGDLIKIKDDYFLVLKTVLKIIESNSYITNCSLYKLPNL